MCHPSEEDRGSQNGRLTMLVNMSVGLCSHRVICDETNFLVKPLSFNMACFPGYLSSNSAGYIATWSSLLYVWIFSYPWDNGPRAVKNIANWYLSGKASWKFDFGVRQFPLTASPLCKIQKENQHLCRMLFAFFYSDFLFVKLPHRGSFKQLIFNASPMSVFAPLQHIQANPQ